MKYKFSVGDGLIKRKCMLVIWPIFYGKFIDEVEFSMFSVLRPPQSWCVALVRHPTCPIFYLSEDEMLKMWDDGYVECRQALRTNFEGRRAR